MGKKKDRRIIVEAAESWLAEMTTYIIPGVLTKEERKSFKKQARKLGAALERRARDGKTYVGPVL